MKYGTSGRVWIGKEGLGKGLMIGLDMVVGYDRVTMIDADKGQGKIQDGYTCQKQVKTDKLLEFVVSMFLSFYKLKMTVQKINKNTHNTLQRPWTDKTVQRTNDTLTQRWFIDCSELNQRT